MLPFKKFIKNRNADTELTDADRKSVFDSLITSKKNVKKEKDARDIEKLAELIKSKDAKGTKKFYGTMSNETKKLVYSTTEKAVDDIFKVDYLFYT